LPLAADICRFRTAEVQIPLGDPSAAKEKLGWTPKTTLGEFVASNVREELKSCQRDELIKRRGYDAMDCHESAAGRFSRPSSAPSRAFGAMIDRRRASAP